MGTIIIAEAVSLFYVFLGLKLNFKHACKSNRACEHRHGYNISQGLPAPLTAEIRD